MKRIIIVFLLLAGLGFAQDAFAQYVGHIEREKANLVDPSGRVLTDDEIIGLVGEDIYYDTVVGARRQMNSGKGLIIGGAAGMGTGLVFAVFSGVAMSKNIDRYSSDSTKARRSSQYTGEAAALYLCSAAFTTAGTLALGGGIALRSIGKGRLGWVAEQCNPRRASATLEWSATPAGAGIVMRF